MYEWNLALKMGEDKNGRRYRMDGKEQQIRKV